MLRTPVAKKTNTGTPPAPGGKVTVKLESSLHYKLRMLASYNGMDLTDYLDQVLRPITDRAYREMGRAINQEEAE